MFCLKKRTWKYSTAASPGFLRNGTSLMKTTPTGVSPMSSFGEGYRHHITGLCHDERGFPTLREDEIEPLISRLFRKISDNLHEIQIVEKYALEDADTAIIAYGSTARSANGQ